jgi:hypothetical protein
MRSGLLTGIVALGLTASAAEPTEVEPAPRTVQADLTAGLTALRSGGAQDATGSAPQDVDLRRTLPGGVVALGIEGPKLRGVEVFGVVTGLLRETRRTDAPLFGSATPRPTRAALGLGPRAHLRAGIDGAVGPRAVDLFGSVGPVVALGLAVADAWQGSPAPHLRLGVHGSVGASTPIGGGVELHTGWRSLLLADATGGEQRRTEAWHLGLFTVGVRVPLGRDTALDPPATSALSPGSSPNPRWASHAPRRPDAACDPG